MMGWMPGDHTAPWLLMINGLAEKNGADMTTLFTLYIYIYIAHNHSSLNIMARVITLITNETICPLYY